MFFEFCSDNTLHFYVAEDPRHLVCIYIYDEMTNTVNVIGLESYLISAQEIKGDFTITGFNIFNVTGSNTIWNCHTANPSETPPEIYQWWVSGQSIMSP